jgi:hypothetical protein
MGTIGTGMVGTAVLLSAPYALELIFTSYPWFRANAVPVDTCNQHPRQRMPATHLCMDDARRIY